MICVCSGTFRVLTNESGYFDGYHFTLSCKQRGDVTQVLGYMIHGNIQNKIK